MTDDDTHLVKAQAQIALPADEFDADEAVDYLKSLLAGGEFKSANTRFWIAHPVQTATDDSDSNSGTA